MFTFKIYALLTLLTTFYFLYSLYQKENQIFLFTIHLVKSKFHFCILINFVLMIAFAFGKIMIKVFFGEVRLSEMIVSLILTTHTASNRKDKNAICLFPTFILDIQA